MEFKVRRSRPPSSGRGAFLVTDDWDDFGFKTTFRLYIGRGKDGMYDIGQLKIGRHGMRPGPRNTSLPQTFEALDESYFSLGQDDTYYETLSELGNELRTSVLSALRDVAFDPEVFGHAQSEEVFDSSLLRFITSSMVLNQYRRIAAGGDKLALYRFRYDGPKSLQGGMPTIRLDFEVRPNSQPPTNIHTLIGSNGVGKTRLLNRIARAVADDTARTSRVGRVVDLSDRDDSPFVNVLVLAFSAFDRMKPFESSAETRTAGGIRCTFVTLEQSSSDDGAFHPDAEGHSGPANSYGALVEEYFNSAKYRRWEKAIRILEADPLFADANVVSKSMSSRPGARGLFDTLSAGHKIVLLAITNLVAHVVERTLVLIDEPETHLHPPLLAAFIRSVSDLLVDRNGVAIIATHSPVVLQETPSNCVYTLRRSGQVIRAERPTIETYGENVGVLTREIFGLEVTRSGFHYELERAVDSGGSFEEILQRFHNKLGAEAQTIVRTLIAVRDSGSAF